MSPNLARTDGESAVAWELLTNPGTLQGRRVEWQTTIIATSLGDRQWEYVVCLRRLEISPHDFPPVPPPRPTQSSQSPPSNTGLRRQSTRRSTNETFRSALEEHDPPRPFSMPMPTIQRPSELPPPTPTRLRQFGPGGGVGGFTPVSPRRGSSRDYSTADYTYRFDTMPSPRTDSGPPHYESANISGGIHANVWPTYNKISEEFDEKRLAKWNADLDVLLIFVSLTSRPCHWFRSD